MEEKIRAEIDSAYVEYKSAVGRQSGVNVSKERLKNILFSHAKDILDILSELKKKDKQIKDLIEERDMLDAALRESDEENAKLRSKSSSKSGK